MNALRLLFPVILVGWSLAPPGFAQPPAPRLGTPVTVVTLADLEQMALHGNPTLAQAAAQVAATQGRALQAGLYPNPFIGYEAEQIGEQGTAGQQGILIEQTIVTGGKLRLNREKFAREASAVQWQAVAQQYRVINTVRLRFLHILALQRLATLYGEFERRADRAAEAAAEQHKQGKAERADVIEARLQVARARSGREDVQTRLVAAWRQLAALVGHPHLDLSLLNGALDPTGPDLDHDGALTRLLHESPELHLAHANVARNVVALRREQVEPIPNVKVDVGTLYDFADRTQQAKVEIGVRLPLFDKNQGNIKAAEAELARVKADVTRVELNLRHRLAEAFAVYRTARSNVREYRDEVLPEAKEVYELRLESFRKGKGQWSDVRDAQQEFFQLSSQHVQNLLKLRKTEVAICGLLLVDGLDAPPPPPSQGQPHRANEQRRFQDEVGESIIDQDGRSLEDRLGNQDD